MLPCSRQIAKLLSGAVAIFGFAPCASAQMHHVEAPERVTRAIGIYEWTGELGKPKAARFVPVSLFINGHFEDAGLYLARPIPFAIEPGDIYALERAGEPEGVLDLDLASRVVTGKALADDDPEGTWYGYGRFTPEAPPPAARLHPAGHLTPIQSSAGPNTPSGTKLPSDTGSDRPQMQRRDGASSSGGSSGGSTPTGAPQTGSTSSTGGSGNPSTTTDSSDDDLDRPTLRRRDPSQDAARRREYGSKKNTASVTAAGPALGADPDRPILGRSNAEADSTPPLLGLPPDMHQSVAVSDATHSEAHPFARAWESVSDQATALARMEALARPMVTAYMQENGLVASDKPLVAVIGQANAAAAEPTQVPAPAAPPKLQRGVPKQYENSAKEVQKESAPASGSSASSAKPVLHSGPVTARSKRPDTHIPALRLQQEEIDGYTLSYGGLPTFVYTASASVSSSKRSIGAGEGSSPVVYVTFVAQRLPTGELQVAMSSVTDSHHLERSPRLRLIDAVDPDDSHRASLLFELRGAGSRQFALYRLTAVHAEQTFTTASIE